jgi:hypothetical protein
VSKRARLQVSSSPPQSDTVVEVSDRMHTLVQEVVHNAHMLGRQDMPLAAAWPEECPKGKTALLREIARLEADQKRLEWQAKNIAGYGMTGRMDLDMSAGTIKEHADKILVRVPCEYLYEWHCYDGATFRDAIDAAMMAGPCQKSKGNGCAKSSFASEYQTRHTVINQF